MALSIADTAVYNENTQINSHPVTLPPNIAAGNLLLVFFVANANPTVTDPAGWTVIATGSNNDQYRIYAKIASGSEGSSVTVDLSGNQRATGAAYRITGNRNGVTSSEIAISTPVDTGEDPPSLTPSWGSAENLWIASILKGTSNYTFTSYPTNYTLGQINNQTGLNNNSNAVILASRLLTATSEDPGAFSLSNTNSNATFTLAIRPSAAAVLAADSGSVTVSGQAATLKYSREIAAAAGNVSISGQAATLSIGRKISAAAGAVAVTGTDASLSISGQKNIVADSGAVLVNGQTAALKIARRIDAAPGAVTVTGAVATLKHGRKVAAPAGSVAVTGTPATLAISHRVIAAQAGAVVVTGQAAAFKRAYRLNAGAGSVVVTGSGALLKRPSDVAGGGILLMGL